MADRGTPPAPRSALTLRMVLAAFGLVVCGCAAVAFVVLKVPVPFVVAAVGFAVVAVVDLVVITHRKRNE
ncbi:hypothetical protein F1D05_01760 [Kribbella qitaiheensis]|uniref:Uncharacterized protein n=1 Tax=Kribbella qitaiheensis TaxID=1544730 RepID=A0A7G6WS89_9ACTN|nr:DUF6343 family protein [Kribbella qitaiheensis]QNE16854.1 hypothetical protein F1D05_01760 [Kribbella qitaiheensis]